LVVAGCHTASTAGGDVVSATVGSTTHELHGVAPKAWIMSYRVFYLASSGRDTADDTEIIMALEDVVEDGADVVINSWGAGPYKGGPYEYDHSVHSPHVGSV
jgi:hypothetical protein